MLVNAFLNCLGKSAVFGTLMCVSMVVVVAEDKLVASWTFDTTDQTSTYFDATGNGFNAVTDAFSTVNGKIDSGLLSNPDADNVTISNSVTNFDFTTFTIECLFYSHVKLSNPGSFDNFVSLFEHADCASGVARGYALKITDYGKPIFGVANAAGNGWVTCEGTEALEDSTWYLITAVHDGAALRLFINGVLVKEVVSNQSYVKPTVAARIGSQLYLSDVAAKTGTVRNVFNGIIDNLRLYNYPLSMDTVIAHCKQYSLYEKKENQLIAHWSFDSTDQSSTYYDVTKNGYNAKTGAYSIGTSILGNGLLGSTTANDVAIPNSIYNFDLPKFSVEATIYSHVKLVNRGSFENMKSVFEHIECADGVARGYALKIMDNGLAQFAIANASGTGWVVCEGGDTLRDSTWYHLAGTFDGVNLRLYVNGALVKQVAGPASYPSPTIPARIGSQFYITNTANRTGRIRNAFIGIIDELKLFNYALSQSDISAEFERTNAKIPEKFEINLGMKTTHASAGDTVIMPLYIANHADYSISSLQMKLTCDTVLLKLVSISKDSGIISNWQLFEWNNTTPGTVPVAFAGEETKITYGEGELFRCTYIVSANAEKGDTCRIGIQDVNVDEKADRLVTTVQNGRVIISKDDILYGDVSGNGEVSVLDAQLVLKNVIGSLPLPSEEYKNFTLAVADVTGNGLITSYDAALILQYSIGLISSFPVETKRISLAKVRTVAAEDAPVEIVCKGEANGQVTYDVVASSLRGFTAGEFVISCQGNGEQLLSSIITTTVRGAKLFSRFDQNANKLRVAVVSNDDIDDNNEITLIRIVCNSVSGEGKPVFNLEKTLVNEGAIPTKHVNNNTQTGIAPDGLLNDKYPLLKMYGKVVQVTSKIDLPIQLNLYNLQGRSVLSTTLNLTIPMVELGELPEGTYLYKVQQGKVSRFGSVLVLPDR